MTERINRAMAEAQARFDRAAAKLAADGIKDQARVYERTCHLPKWLTGHPFVDPEAARFICDRPDDEIIARLRWAKDGERRKGIEGHWAYDGWRLRALKSAYLAERLNRLRKRAGSARRAA